MGQKLAAYDSNGNITAFYDTVDSPAPAGISAIEITDTQWRSCISTTGYSVKNGQLVAPSPPTAAQLLAIAQSSQIALLSAACANAIISGFTSSALGSAYNYPSKVTDQQNLASSVLASMMPNITSTWTTPFWCADTKGVWAFRDHTAAQIQQVGQDAKAAILANMTKNQSLAAQVQAATSVAAVEAVVWS